MIEILGMTDIGLVRRENQDAYAVRETTASGYSICVVCDGMGGYAGGKLASGIASETFLTELEKRLRPEMTPTALQEASSAAVSMANEAIRKNAAQSPQFQNMGTTLVSAVIYDGGAVVSNVGDSRAYHITPRGITQVTRDHSLVEDMMERGDITAEEARRHPKRKYITRALGPDADAQCDCYVCSWQPGEYLLLCTDGLVNTVTDQEIWETVLQWEPEPCLARLLEISKSHGASDNVTVVLARNL